MYPDAATMIPKLTGILRRSRAVWAPTADELQRRYLSAILNYVSGRIGVGPEAEDITAEVFVAAFASLHRCPSPTGSTEDHDPVRAYLFGIARRKLADVYRRQARHPEEALTEEAAVSVGGGPESDALADEAAEMLRKILAQLPELQAEALLLKYVEGLSLAEIGLVVGKSAGAVGQLLHRARENARRHGASYFTDDFPAEGADDAQRIR